MSLLTDQIVRNDPDRLYAAIVLSLQKDTTDGLENASARLLEIDPDQERATITNGLVSLCLGKNAQAVQVLKVSLAKFGMSGAALTNLAKAYNALGQTELAMETLRSSLHIDPNQSAGLMWYAKLRQVGGGSEGLLDAFREIANEPGSWRALLWLARDHLDHDRSDRATELYRKALSIGHDSDALLMISGDLGKHSLPEDAISLVLPL